MALPWQELVWVRSWLALNVRSHSLCVFRVQILKICGILIFALGVLN